MAKLISNEVEMNCTLVLTEREVAMLAWLSGYGAKAIAASITEDLRRRSS